MDNTETVQVVTEKDGAKYEEGEQIRATQSKKLLMSQLQMPQKQFYVVLNNNLNQHSVIL